MENTDLKELIRLRDEKIERKALACACSLYEFFLTFWEIMSGDTLILNWHIRYLCDQLQHLGNRLVAREVGIEDLIINIPPGMTKSTIVSQAFPVWLWLHAPHFVIISSSYSAGLSLDHSLRAKAIVKSDKFNELFQWYFIRRFGRPFQLVKDNEADWRNTYGGLRYATSTNGTVTGKHAHLIIRDDPINPEQAESKAYRERCNRFNDRTLSSRKVDKDRVPTVTVMQRLHTEDSTGHDLSKLGKPIKHICLPAELTNDVNPPELRMFYKNGLLDEKRLSRDTLHKAKIDLGSYGYAGQMLQTPVQDGGNTIKEAWFNFFSIGNLEEEAASEKVSLQWKFTLDGAYTEEDKNDPTAIFCYCEWKNKIYVRDVIAVRMEMPELLRFIPEFVNRNGYNRYYSKIYIEPKANGMSVAQMLKNSTKLNIVLDKPPREDKVARLAACVPFVESGRLYLLKNAGWLQNFVQEVIEFPLGEHDDQADVMVMAIRRAIEPERRPQRWHG